MRYCHVWHQHDPIRYFIYCGVLFRSQQIADENETSLRYCRGYDAQNTNSHQPVNYWQKTRNQKKKEKKNVHISTENTTNRYKHPNSKYIVICESRSLFPLYRMHVPTIPWLFRILRSVHHDHKYEQIDFSSQKINSRNVSFIMMLSRLVSSYSLAAVSALTALVCERNTQVESMNKCEEIWSVWSVAQHTV